MIDELDTLFGNLVGFDDAPTHVIEEREAPPNERDSSDVRALFAELAADHMRQVRDFMLDVRAGEAPREWLVICAPAVHSLRRAAESMGTADLCRALDDFASGIELAEGVSVINGPVRDELLSAYEALAKIMPATFALEGERDRRESVIVHALLQQVQDVGKVTIDKVYAAGLTRLDVFYLASRDDLAAATGIDKRLAERIVAKFQDYRRTLRAPAAEGQTSPDRARLLELVTELRQQNDELEGTLDGWANGASDRKRHLRQARVDTLLQAKVVLARLGEVDLLSEIEKLPFQRKIERLGVVPSAVGRRVGRHRTLTPSPRAEAAKCPIER